MKCDNNDKAKKKKGNVTASSEDLIRISCGSEEREVNLIRISCGSEERSLLCPPIIAQNAPSGQRHIFLGRLRLFQRKAGRFSRPVSASVSYRNLSTCITVGVVLITVSYCITPRVRTKVMRTIADGADCRQFADSRPVHTRDCALRVTFSLACRFAFF